MVYRIYVEKKKEFNTASRLAEELKSVLGVNVGKIRKFLRYDVEGIDGETMKKASYGIFSEPPVDNCYDSIDDKLFGSTLVVEYLEGQYDQRADSAMQCVQLLTGGLRPEVRCAAVYTFDGIDEKTLKIVKNYLINPVDSREGSFAMPKTLKRRAFDVKKMRVELDGFITMDEEAFEKFYADFGFAMTFYDLKFVREYFKKQGRNPTLTEIKVIDTYWSDHCRHTTFLTEIKNVEICGNPHIKDSYRDYGELFKSLYKDRDDKYPCLMDIATIAAKKLKREGKLDNLDVSDEINACSVKVDVDVDGKDEEWLIMFKNETHNHPTEIEPFGGAATCLGGAIRDPLSGRTYVYQAMRVTGAGNPLEPFENTIKGKLPQRVLTKTASAGFSSYGNQIGLATGIVTELYNDRYKAKRLETGYVIGGAPKGNVVRKKPKQGDIVLLLGGDTGRDGCGGATGSSKSHTVKSVEECGAEVQKGNAPEERKLQRLFRNENAARLIIKCNDFGAGGVCVAIGELSDGIDIYLDKVNKKYEGLTATELAISESQERMAVVVEAENVDAFCKYAEAENLKVKEVGVITDKNRLVMYYGNEVIVDIERSFLDTNGVKQTVNAEINDDYSGYFDKIDEKTEELLKTSSKEALKYELRKLNNCSQKGMGETFDSTIGAGTVLMPFGGLNGLTPTTAMASKPPVKGSTETVTASSFACYPELMIHSPFLGASYSIIGAVAKLISVGVKYDTIRLTLQEFFKKLGKDASRWGEPLSALLGALDAQLKMGLAAIGGKDSMSGSFENIDVPPTLIAFAMGITKEKNVVHNVFPSHGKVYSLPLAKDEKGYPDYEKLTASYRKIERAIAEGKISHVAVVEGGGRLVCLSKSLFGDGNGAKLFNKVTADDFKPLYGELLVVSENLDVEGVKPYAELTPDRGIFTQNEKIDLDEAVSAFTSTLEGVYPTSAKAERETAISNYSKRELFKAKSSVAKPRVFIPVFPGTNCEYDTARAFERAGALPEIFVVNNLSARGIEESIEKMKKIIGNSQIIAFPGGFSGGDEPDGSGKFIATAFRNPVLKECVEELLYTRDGLILGICNGFQALIKLGLLPYGRIELQNAFSPTLTYNNIGKHVSSIVDIRVGSVNSPWLSACRVGDIYSVPVSHGEGKFVCNDEHFERMLKNGQIATQYVDRTGAPTTVSPYNPNGARYGVEGIISLDGRVFGKMGHTERFVKGLYKNVEGNFKMPVFESGVEYYR